MVTRVVFLFCPNCLSVKYVIIIRSVFKVNEYIYNMSLSGWLFLLLFSKRLEVEQSIYFSHLEYFSEKGCGLIKNTTLIL